MPLRFFQLLRLFHRFLLLSLHLHGIFPENAELVEEITINGMSGMAVVKDGQPHVVLWYFNAVSPNDTFVVDIDGSTGVTLETIKTVAENLTVVFNEREE